MTDELELLDWKRRVFAIYAGVRAAADHGEAWRKWVAARDELFRDHPSSPLPPEARTSYPGVPYFPYDPASRVLASVGRVEAGETRIGSSGTEAISFARFGRAQFELAGTDHALDLYWLMGYGGGLFLPFCDQTSGAETSGGGRYLFDTVKGADLGTEGDRLVLDFNFAYNPSCSYDPRWVCPLSPPANRLPVAVRAGERMPGA